MVLDQVESYIFKKEQAVKEHPFGPGCDVYKVCNKMFALITPEKGIVNLKCHPDDAPSLRAMFEGITPGYHMNKAHWNSVVLDGTVPLDVIKKLVDDSWELVVAGLTKAQKSKLGVL